MTGLGVLIKQVINYVIEKMVLDKPVDALNPDGTFAPGLAGGQLQPSAVAESLRGNRPWHKLKPSIEILCSNQASHPIELVCNNQASASA